MPSNLWLPKYKYVNLTVSADIVAAVTAKKIRVLGLHVDEEAQVADVILTIKSSSDGATLHQFSGFDIRDKELSLGTIGWFETVAGDALYGTVAGTGPNLNLCVVYVEI